MFAHLRVFLLLQSSIKAPNSRSGFTINGLFRFRRQIVATEKMCRVIVAILLLCASAVFAQDCTSPMTWSTGNGNILLNGHPFVLKGVNYFGFETDTWAPHGLWSYSLDGILDFVKANNFNAIRLPFSMQLALTNPTNPNVDCNSNPNICHLSALDLMNAFIDSCAARGILVMLDSHVLSVYGGITELWYDSGTYTEANVLAGWDIILNRFASKWNVFAIDLKNEPHGAASWGWNAQSTDWNLAAQRFITYINTNHPSYNGLFFVEGVGENAASPNTNSPAHFWGENLEGITWHPLATGNSALDARIVYSPHVYGPDVYNQNYFQTSDFPGNMPAIWNEHFGYAEALTGHPVVLGEWGGYYTSGSPDVTWQNALAAWLETNCMTDQFYWCLNPDSGDTGGLLGGDWSTPNTQKLALLAGLVPYPTNFTVGTDGSVCVTHGWFVNSACGSTVSTSSTASTASTSTASTTTPSTTASTTTPSTTTPSTTPSTTASTTASSSTSSSSTSSSTGGGGGGDGAVTISGSQVNSWDSNGLHYMQVNLVITNNGASSICGFTMQMTPSTTSVTQFWNLNQLSGGQWNFPSWMNIGAGQTFTSAGMVIQDTTQPTFSAVAGTITTC